MNAKIDRRNRAEQARNPSARVHLPIGAIVLLLLAAALLAAGRTGVRHDDLLAANETVALAQGWTDETGAAVSMPLFLKGPPGETHSYRVTLPEQSARAPALFFTARYLNARFYLDGAPLGESLAQPPGASHSMGKVFTLLPLPEGCGGKELRMEVELLLGEDVLCEIPAPLAGCRAGVLSMLLKENLLTALADLLVFCLSLLLFLFGMQRGPLSRDGTFMLMGLFTMCFALYSLCSTDVLHLFCTNSYLIYLAEFLLLALLPLPMVLAFALQCKAPFRQLLYADLLLLLGNLLLQGGLHFFSPLEVRNTVFITHGAMLLSLTLMIPALLWGWDGVSRKWMLFSFTPIFFGTLADITLFYVSTRFRTTFFVEIGVLLFVVIQVYGLIRRYLEHYEDDLKNNVYRRMAYVDALTGLQNRAAFEQRIEELEKSLTSLSSLWCICADINDLKRVNDNAGHAAGDRLIRGAAEALHTSLCEDCTIYRTGGDEFVLFITDRPEASITEGRQRLRQALEAYNRENPEPLSIAVGYDRFSFDGSDTVAELISRADARMYEDKRRLKQSAEPAEHRETTSLERDRR